jgi:rSAM/selenodomain-associated transferase 1
VSPRSGINLLVVAKAPVVGRVKTRLAATTGERAAAEVAAAALLDTLAACRTAVGAARCRLAVAGRLDESVAGDELAASLGGWTVVGQRSGTLGERLAHALTDVPGPVLQIGMDTPQVTADLLLGVAERLADDPAVLGPAEDGGWWALGLRRPGHAAVLADVAMSRPTTYDDTRAALVAEGLGVADAPALRDVDRAADADAVAAAAPATRFARAWGRVGAR